MLSRNQLTPLRFVIGMIKPFKIQIFVFILVSTFFAVDLSLRPYVLKVMVNTINTIAPQEAITELFWPSFWYLFLSLAVSINFRILDFVWLNLNHPLKQNIGHALMERMMHHSQSFFNNNFSGNLATKVKDVMSSVPDLVKTIIENFYGRLLTVFIAIFTLSHVHPKFAVILFIWSMVFITVAILIAKRSKVLSDDAAEKSSQMVGRFVDILGNILSVRLFSATSYEQKRVNQAIENFINACKKRDWYLIKIFAFQGFSFVLYQIVCLLWLVESFHNQSITAGDFVMILTINISIVTCLWDGSKEISKFAEYLGTIVQGLRVILSPIEITDQEQASVLQVTKGEIVFDKVKFHYKGDEALFENKSVVIKASQKVGLVGYSGGGKSTFVNLILRLFNINRGRILIDGVDIKTVTQESLRHNIGMIPQDPALFHRTLMENIRYGNPNASDKEVIEAAKKANAHQFIMKTPEKYHALVGERGIKLSGGQRQRIAIARAFLKNAPILILDEATSQLDSITEHEIQESLWELMKGKTTLIIAHRLSTLLKMDRILVFDHGRIIEDGTHKDLLKRKGLYKTLWDAQIGGFFVDSQHQNEDHS